MSHLFFKFVLGVNSAELTGAKHSDFSSQEIEEVMKNWYKTKILNQFPGSKEPFESCSNTSSAKDYELFTQVRVRYKIT